MAIQVHVWINKRCFVHPVAVPQQAQLNLPQLIEHLRETNSLLYKQLARAQQVYMCVAHQAINSTTKISAAEYKFDARCAAHGFDATIIGILKLARLGYSLKQIQHLPQHRYIKVASCIKHVMRKLQSKSLVEVFYKLGAFSF